MIDSVKIGRAIRTLREKAGLTQQQLADQLFLTAMAVSKWERGKSVPDPATLMKLAPILDMDVDGLLDGTATYLDDRWRGALLLPEDRGVRADTVLWDKPLIDFLLSLFLLAGVRDIRVGCGEADRVYIDGRFRGGEALGVRLRLSPPEELTAGEPEGGEPGDLMLMTAPLFLYGVDLTHFLQRAMQRRYAAVQMAAVVGRGGVKLREGFTQYEYRPLPLYFVQERFLAGLESGTPLAQVPELAEKKHRLRVEPMNKGFVFSSLESAESLAEVSTLIKAIQRLGDYLVCCPLEAAWRRGMIGEEKLLREAERFPEYRGYVEGL